MVLLLLGLLLPVVELVLVLVGAAGRQRWLSAAPAVNGS